MTGESLEDGDEAPSDASERSSSLLADAESDSLARCPRCGGPMTVLTVRGPGDRRVSPCGCRL
ncbi:hypothetical protein [Natronobiforma cellulositropha]|uniref:hypothetical protein n=1 Tax=Natronobiforma cellulositropha TaxID=1679076 RepID=UPI0021D56C09|nr:hypothetical protein [Natronobiforma cellulositropha]